MSALGERIRFLAENPEVGTQTFSALEAQQFRAEIFEAMIQADHGGEWGDPGEELRQLAIQLGVVAP